MKNHNEMTTDEREAATARAAAAGLAAAPGGPWLVVAAHVGPDGRVYLTRTTAEFPTGAYPAALRLLWDNIAESLIGPRPAPLPVVRLGHVGGPVESEMTGPPDEEFAVGLEEAIDRR